MRKIAVIGSGTSGMVFAHKMLRAGLMGKRQKHASCDGRHIGSQQQKHLQGIVRRLCSPRILERNSCRPASSKQSEINKAVSVLAIHNVVSLFKELVIV